MSCAFHLRVLFGRKLHSSRRLAAASKDPQPHRRQQAPEGVEPSTSPRGTPPTGARCHCATGPRLHMASGHFELPKMDCTQKEWTARVRLSGAPRLLHHLIHELDQAEPMLALGLNGTRTLKLPLKMRHHPSRGNITCSRLD